MIRKALLVFTLLFVGIPGAFLTFEHFRGQRRLTATIARLTAQGERLDIAAIAPPPSAASHGIDRLLRVAPLLQGGASLSPPAMRCISAGRAAPSSRLESWENSPRKSVTWPALTEWVDQSEEAFASLHATLALPEIRFSPNYADGFKMLLPHLAPVKSATLALSASAARAAHDGDFDPALADLNAMGRVTAILSHEPVAISQLVRVALVTIALNRAWDVLHSREWNDEQLIQLDAALPRDDLLRDMVTALEGERAIGQITMRQMKGADIADMLDGFTSAFGGNTTPSFTMPDSLDAATELAGEMASVFGQSVRNRLLLPIWRFAFNDHAIAAYLDAMQAFIENSRTSLNSHRMLPFPSSNDSGSLPGAHAGRIDWSKNLYTQSAIASLSSVLIKAFTADIQRTLLRTDIALHRYKLRHGRYPASLDALVPALLPAVPIDAADGQPIRYRFTPDQPDPVLWSVGENGVDDGGDPAPGEYNVSAMFFWWRGKDAVWPQPASSSEIAAWIDQEQKPRGRGPSTLLPDALMKRYGLLPRTPPSTNADAATNAPTPDKR